MRRVFIDSDVILDCVLNRVPFSAESSALLSACELGHLEGITSTLVLANCYYVFCRQADASSARDVVGRLRTLLTVCPVGDREFGEALASDFAYVEDGIQHFVAVNNGGEAIATRNVRDYGSSAIPVCDPAQVLALLANAEHGDPAGPLLPPATTGQ